MVVINIALQGWANVMISPKLSSRHCKSSVINIVSQKKMKNYSFLILKLYKNVSVWNPEASLYQTKSAEFQNVRQSLSLHSCCSGKLCLLTVIFQSVRCSHALIPFHSHDLFVLLCSPRTVHQCWFDFAYLTCKGGPEKLLGPILLSWSSVILKCKISSESSFT